MEEIIDIVEEPSVEEEVYDLAEILLKSHDLIRVEMNAIEYPLFTKNKKVKSNQILKYVFDSEKNKYLEVKPAVNNKIPLEFDENIFFALMRLYKKQSHSKKIYFDWRMLIEESGISYTGANLKKAKEALERMTETIYIFNNLFYSNEVGNILNDKISTTMFSKREIEFKEVQNNREELLVYFRNKHIKTIVEVNFNDYFYNNIIRKGFLYFDSKELLLMKNAVTRSLYMLLTKWRHGSFYIKRHSKFLASRIPLSWKKQNQNKSVKVIEKSLNELKSLNLIKDYNLTKKRYYETSYFEIFFDKSHNKNYVKRESSIQEKIQIENIIEVEEIETQKIKLSKKRFEELITEYLKENDLPDVPIQRGIARTSIKNSNKYIIEED